MESDRTFEEGVGMRLDLGHKRTLTIGADKLLLDGNYGTLGGYAWTWLSDNE